MKKLIFGLAFLGSMAFGTNDVKAQGVGGPGGGIGGFECKVEIFICNYFTGSSRQVCHQNGDGVSCLCGESTTCP
ncbi:hypothetical protein [Algoriphagus sp.]|jgi:hypothetical protein|uniref:hypothetical protein n=1 Tax=Algoriphagus sp. TaxID=1872435 RepID=UPI00271AF6BC|nr:hypothetical protein [Algoriphagus sp.]MDO8965398.1 hypothetical protein [Algoriphagus sp.]MDP3201437.1 hypothetical protein [Algoriphagus sp.]